MPAKTKKTATADYFELVKRFPLRPIRSKAQLAQAHGMIDELSIRPEDNLTRGELDYLLVLGDLTLKYESGSELDEPIGGLELLKHLMEANDLAASDIGRIIGQRQLGSKILRGDRQISKTHAKRLGAHFGLPAEIFLRNVDVTHRTSAGTRSAA